MSGSTRLEASRTVRLHNPDASANRCKVSRSSFSEHGVNRVSDARIVGLYRDSG